ncbi:hypothetical protein M5K25_005440 [Dendrobium thyrsiflorum]|uniref:H15 domain-containing protein n=1 Tax=Dendrobium thyrsiflorum TaxID=117978 RepID=A0ABD0VPP3_DENTH
MATEEVLAPVVEEHVADPAHVDPTGEAGDPAASKEEKPKHPRKPRAPASHPPYIEMIQEAITSLKEKTGSSQYAITKFIEQKHKDNIPPNFKKLLLFQLRKLTAAGKLSKAKVTSKPKPNASVAKPSIKPKAEAVVKPNKKSAVSAKPKAKTVAAKPKTKSVSKLKPVAKVPKPKPKTVATKAPTSPAKAAKTSEKDTPGNKKVAKPVKKVSSAKTSEKAKRAKPTAKAASKKTPARKTKKL